MIGKRGKWMIVLYMIFLLVLFLMCSTDLIIREPEKEIYQVAVIIEDVRDDQYSNFRRGMEQAAVEFNADVRFITLYEKLDAAQQMELIEREQQDGADALIIVPVDELLVADALEGKQIGIPAVLLSSGQTESLVAKTIVVDYEKMGEELAGQALAKEPEGCPVLLLTDSKGSGPAGRRFREGAERVLQENGREFQRIEWEPKQFPGTLRETAAASGQKAVILAESPEILAEAAGLLGDDSLLQDDTEGLYGRGSTMTIFNELDKGLISGICVTDEFKRGYTGVQLAVQAQEGLRRPEEIQVDFYYIEKKDLRAPAYEALLFPIE